MSVKQLMIALFLMLTHVGVSAAAEPDSQAPDERGEAAKYLHGSMMNERNLWLSMMKQLIWATTRMGTQEERYPVIQLAVTFAKKAGNSDEEIFEKATKAAGDGASDQQFLYALDTGLNDMFPPALDPAARRLVASFYLNEWMKFTLITYSELPNEIETDPYNKLMTADQTDVDDQLKPELLILRAVYLGMVLLVGDGGRGEEGAELVWEYWNGIIEHLKETASPQFAVFTDLLMKKTAGPFWRGEGHGFETVDPWREAEKLAGELQQDLERVLDELAGSGRNQQLDPLGIVLAGDQLLEISKALAAIGWPANISKRTWAGLRNFSPEARRWLKLQEQIQNLLGSAPLARAIDRIDRQQNRPVPAGSLAVNNPAAVLGGIDLAGAVRRMNFPPPRQERARQELNEFLKRLGDVPRGSELPRPGVVLGTVVIDGGNLKKTSPLLLPPGPTPDIQSALFKLLNQPAEGLPEIDLFELVTGDVSLESNKGIWEALRLMEGVKKHVPPEKFAALLAKMSRVLLGQGDTPKKQLAPISGSVAKYLLLEAQKETKETGVPKVLSEAEQRLLNRVEFGIRLSRSR